MQSHVLFVRMSRMRAPLERSAHGGESGVPNKVRLALHPLAELRAVAPRERVAVA
jgi:hypothetical protein